ncbi:SPOC domain-containing protein 1 isoform X4 [Monodelphis domestica]|uniref:SPOC domain-containing protein 1 isoform X4 n=1 Tax=Monodelphis domestica TaxID=13616 RepID=UPI0024E22CE0|nr:SPOC domain-containing protein 1 isoform X4 [Monodelphis domestica]
MSGDGEGEDAFGPKDVLLYSPDSGPFVEETEEGSSVLSWTWEQSTASSQWSPEPEATRSTPPKTDRQDDSNPAEKALQNSETMGRGTGPETTYILGPDRQAQEEGKDSLLSSDLHVQPSLAPTERKAQFLEKLHVALHDILAENWGKKLGSTGKGERSVEAESCPDLQEFTGEGSPPGINQRHSINYMENPPEMRWLTPVAFPECLSEVCEQGIFSRLALGQDMCVDCPLDACEEAKEGEKGKRQQPDASPPSPSLTLERANKKSRLSTNFRQVRRRRRNSKEEGSWRRDERKGRDYLSPAQSAGRVDPKSPGSSFRNSSRETCGEMGTIAGTSLTVERGHKLTGKTQQWTCQQRALSTFPASFSPHSPTDPLLPKGAGIGEPSGHTPSGPQRCTVTATSAMEALGPPGRPAVPNVMPVSKTSWKNPDQCPLAASWDPLTSPSFSRLSGDVSTEHEDLGFAMVAKAGDDDTGLSDIAEELESAVGKGAVGASDANRQATLGLPVRPQGFSTTSQPCGQAGLGFPLTKSSSKGLVASGASLDPEVAEPSSRPSRHRRNRPRAGEKPRKGLLSTAQEWGRNGGSRPEESTRDREPARVSRSRGLGSGSSVKLLGAVSQAWEPRQPAQLEELEDLSGTSSEAPSRGSQLPSSWAKGPKQERGATKDVLSGGETKQPGRASVPMTPAEKAPPSAETKAREQKRRPAKEKPPSVPGPSLQLSGEQVRSAVAESLREVLLKRLQEPANLAVGEEAVRGIAANIEAAIFDLMQCTDYRYKTKYRSLVFNLRDPRNKDLFLQVIRGDITPQGLVRMSATELASQELAEWRDREVKHGLEIIEKQQREAPSFRVTKLTHKGEIEIHTDVDQTLTLEDLTEPASHLDLSLRPQAGATESQSGRDTTEQHESHFLDPDCRVCMGWEAPRGGRGFHVPRSIPPSRSKVTSTPQRLSGPASLPRVDAPLPGTSKSRTGPRTQPQDRPEPASCPRQALKSKALPGRPLWEGALEMFSIKRFAAKAHVVYGSGSQLIQALPKVIHSAGCVLPEVVWDYLDSIWPSEAKEISVVRLCPRGARDAQNYNMLYSYLNNKQRYGMVASEHLDMFLVPLPAFQPVPPKLRPLGGPGLEATHCSLVLGLILPKAPPGSSRLNGTSSLQEKKRKTVTFKETVETKCYSPGCRNVPVAKAGPSWAPRPDLDGPPPWEEVSADLLEEVAGRLEQEPPDAGRGPCSFPFCCQQDGEGPGPDGSCPAGGLGPSEPLAGWAQLGAGARAQGQRAQPFGDGVGPGLLPLAPPLHPECGGLTPELGALGLLQLAGLFHFGSPPAVALAPAPGLVPHPPAADCYHPYPEHGNAACPHGPAGAACPPAHGPLLPAGEALSLIQHLEALVKMNSQLQASLQMSAPEPALPGAPGAPGPLGMEQAGGEAEGQPCPPPPLFLAPFCGSEQPPPGY